MVFRCLLCLILAVDWPIYLLLHFLWLLMWAGTQRKETSTPLLCNLYIWFDIFSKRSCLHEYSDWMLVSVQILSVAVVTLYWPLSFIHCNANIIGIISTVHTERWSNVQCQILRWKLLFLYVLFLGLLIHLRRLIIHQGIVDLYSFTLLSMLVFFWYCFWLFPIIAYLLLECRISREVLQEVVLVTLALYSADI